MYTNVNYLTTFVYILNMALYNLIQCKKFVDKLDNVDKISTFIYTVEICIQTEHNIMSDSRTIPVRMPEDLYQEVLNSKPAELKVSTYLLLLLRKGLTTFVDNLSTFVDRLSTRDIERLVRDVVADVRIELVNQTNELLTPLHQEVNEIKTELMGK